MASALSRGLGRTVTDIRPEETESVCPVCLARISARRTYESEVVFLVKECVEHGLFRTPIWRGTPSMKEWQRPKEPVHPEVCYGSIDAGCPFDCGLCAVHSQMPCSVLIEVTDRCNLRCPVCFADSGGAWTKDPSLSRISWLLKRAMAAVGPCNLQLSGGEPTLRDDLPEIVRIARETGYSFIQLNTNGLRLAAEADYATRLAEAGLSSVFLQFDDVDDESYRQLRGRPLLDEKLRAIEHCAYSRLGVILVPTVMGGINSSSVGAVVRFGLSRAPAVRGIHFQPASFFGRFPQKVGDGERVTLPELMRSLEEQMGGLVKVSDFSPPGCEHAHCSFHATYLNSSDGTLRPIAAAGETGCCLPTAPSGEGVKKTVETVSRRWRVPSEGPFEALRLPFVNEKQTCCNEGASGVRRVEDALDLDCFLREMAARSFTISAMAFQDADNLDLERLRSCCIAVISPDGRLIPFCAYNLTSTDGKSLYRNHSWPASL